MGGGSEEREKDAQGAEPSAQREQREGGRRNKARTKAKAEKIKVCLLSVVRCGQSDAMSTRRPK
eukprot:2153121-Pyramimonas_sp.AAC.1